MKPRLLMHSTLIPEPFRSRLLALGSASNGSEFLEGSAKNAAAMDSINDQIDAIQKDCRAEYPELFKPPKKTAARRFAVVS